METLPSGIYQLQGKLKTFSPSFPTQSWQFVLVNPNFAVHMRSVFLQSSSSNHSTCHTVISVTITCKRRLVSHTTDSRKPADSLQMSNLSVSRFSNHISLNIAALFIWNFPNPNNTFLRLLGSLGSLGPPYTHVREEGSQQRRRHVFTRLRTADEMLNKLNSPCGDEAV